MGWADLVRSSSEMFAYINDGRSPDGQHKGWREHMEETVAAAHSRRPISHGGTGDLGIRRTNGRLTGLYSSPYSNFRRAIDSSARRRSLSRITSNSAMYLAANSRTRSRGSSNHSKTSRRFFS